ncbi:LamB/YcsF family protein [Azospirillum doebereinerae]|uniref:LamB/YcsF family protein n=1 Tax=Azospirillum doebereinerae TaxID=92933 RepID=UPI001EE51D99|nr:5-oxoprolinase subunit PxpA [Azospirillum doebereinerae]MCG5239433.1 5-oxoprolinase subunit PxpA [Azospirillum doebereinerae]
MAAIDLNCDMGEGFGAWAMGDDRAMLDIVTSANIACGFHAGDPSIMAETARLALEKGVRIGAHPGFDDRAGFGRRTIRGDSPAAIERMVAYQIGALQGCAALAGHRVTHVKPHGALYNMAAVEADLAMAIARAVKAVDPALLFVVPPLSAMDKAGAALGLRVLREAFADRTYEDDGTLTPRSVAGSVIHAPELAAERVVRMVLDGAVTSRHGTRLPIVADTICVHGDTPTAVAMAGAVRVALEKAGVLVRPPHPVQSATA